MQHITAELCFTWSPITAPISFGGLKIHHLHLVEREFGNHFMFEQANTANKHDDVHGTMRGSAMDTHQVFIDWSTLPDIDL
jgi:hypothetical protein